MTSARKIPCPEDLNAFIALIEAEGELARVSAPVDPYLEIAAIVERVSKGDGGGRALLFKEVVGAKMPLVANLFGSRRRMQRVFGGADIGGLAARLARDLAASGVTEGAAALAAVTAGLDAPPRPVASCRYVNLGAEGLTALPALHAWPQDGGRYLTLGQVFTKDPEQGRSNCGIYRLQLLGRDRALLRCHPGSGCRAHMEAWHARGEALPVAIILGGPPVLTWAASAPLPETVSETSFASYLCGQSIAMMACQNSALAVPATAEIVLEGRILPGEEALEGPFGNHTGSYAPAGPAPVLRIDRALRREDAICPCTVVGPPPMENVWLAATSARLLFPLLQHELPWVRALHMPRQGIFHRAALLAVDTAEPMRDLAERLWQAPLLRNARLLVLLDAGVDPGQADQAYWRLVNAPDWDKTVLVSANRLVIDAREAEAGRRVGADRDTLAKLGARWDEYGLEGFFR